MCNTTLIGTGCSWKLSKIRKILPRTVFLLVLPGGQRLEISMTTKSRVFHVQSLATSPIIKGDISYALFMVRFCSQFLKYFITQFSKLRVKDFERLTSNIQTE